MAIRNCWMRQTPCSKSTNEAIYSRKLEQLAERFEEITALLADPQIQGEQNRFRSLSREYAQLEPVVSCYHRYQSLEEEIAGAREMLDDPEMADLAKEEIATSEEARQALEPELQLLLLPADPNDQRNIFLEIRAGTGGAEAALFTGDLLRMYLATPSSRVGRQRQLARAKAIKGAIRRSSAASSVAMSTHISSSSRAHTAFNGFLKLSLRGAFTPPPVPLPSCRKLMLSTKSISTPMTCE